MRSMAGLLLVGLVLVPSVVRSQEPRQARVGDRARVTAPSCGLHGASGLITSLDGVRLVGIFNGREAHCPTEALAALDVSTGERKWWRASLTGTWIGTLVGFVVAGIAYANEPAGEDNLRVLAFVFIPPAGAVMGLVVGTGVGILRGTDTWKPVAIPAVLPSPATPWPRRIDLGLSVPIIR